MQDQGRTVSLDGTLFDSDPVHFAVFQELLAKEGINGGRPIDHAFFNTGDHSRAHIAHARELSLSLPLCVYVCERVCVCTVQMTARCTISRRSLALACCSISQDRIERVLLNND